MLYEDGQTIEIGDTVALGGQDAGTVVGLIQEARYAPGYKAQDWQMLDTGLVIRTSFGDLRLEEPDEDFKLVARASTL